MIIRIILTILRIVGITAGILILLVLGLLLLVLFAAFRYHLQIRKDSGGISGSGSLSWLLGMIRLEISAAGKKPSSPRLFLFGVPAERYRGILKRKKTKGGYSGRRENANEDGKTRDTEKLPEIEEIHETKKQAGPAEIPEVEKQAEPAKVNKIGKPPKPGKNKIKKEFKNPLPDIWHKTQSRIADLVESIRSGVKKGGDLLDGLKNYEVPEVIRLAGKELRYLLSHYRFRKIKGFLEYGTGDPAVTGMLNGVIYLILPAGAGDYEVIPDFYEPVLNTDTAAEGHIRLCHLVPAAVRLIMDARVRRLIKVYRKRNRKGE